MLDMGLSGHLEGPSAAVCALPAVVLGEQSCSSALFVWWIGAEVWSCSHTHSSLGSSPSPRWPITVVVTIQEALRASLWIGT